MTTVVDVPAQTDTAELRLGDQVLTLPIEQATDGQSAINISSLLKEAHLTTLDYGYANTARRPAARSPTSTATPASCATAAIRSRSSPSARRSSRRPTC